MGIFAENGYFAGTAL